MLKAPHARGLVGGKVGAQQREGPADPARRRRCARPARSAGAAARCTSRGSRPHRGRCRRRSQAHVVQQVARDGRLVRAEPVDVARDDIGGRACEGQLKRCRARAVTRPSRLVSRASPNCTLRSMRRGQACSTRSAWQAVAFGLGHGGRRLRRRWRWILHARRAPRWQVPAAAALLHCRTAAVERRMPRGRCHAAGAAQCRARGSPTTAGSTAYHTFSFADYHDPAHMGFRAAARDQRGPRRRRAQGFGTHGHRDMEILTYVLEGALEHKDSHGQRLGDPPGRRAAHERRHRRAAQRVQPLEDRSPCTCCRSGSCPSAERLAPGYEQKHFTAPTSAAGCA